jgi:DUF4097 and DUF4098 domain-containing protein YvlB
MSWLYSIVVAGLMFSSDGNLPVYTNSGYAESNTKKVIKLDETERFEQTYPLSANGRVSVSNVNGSITVETWDRNEVKLVAVKTADDKERLAEVEIEIDSKPDYFRVETNYDNWRERNNQPRRNYGKLNVEYSLMVPRNAVLNEIETVNGSVSIANSNNSTKASSVNGAVKATNLRGTASLSTVNGTVEADFDQLQAGGKISLNTVNGQVNLVIPSDANATVKADSLNGSISNDFGLPVRKGQYVGRDLYGRIGSGDVQIRLNSVNGGLSIRRKADGKNPNPAVNLLSQKSKDDEDWDEEDEDSDEDMDEDSLKATAKSQKDAAKAVKDAQKEIKKIKPELEKLKPEIAQATADAIAQSTVNIAPSIISGVNTAVTEVISEEVKDQIRESIKKQKDAKAKLAEINFNFGAPVVEKKSDSFAVKGTPKVTLDARNCAVSVRGWDKPEVSYSLIKISRASQKPVDRKSTINVRNTESEVNIKVLEEAAPNGVVFNEATKMRLEVYVPKKSNLKIVSNNEIRLEGVSGEIDLQGADESINVRDVDGKLTVSTADGRIRVIGFRGSFDGKTQDGMMNLEGNFQKINAQTVDGTIVLTLPENANATIQSNRKDIEAEGVSLVYVGDGRDVSTWKIGNGGAGNYRLYTTAEGQVFIRAANSLMAN